MNRHNAVFVTVGAVATVLGLGLLFVPGTLAFGPVGRVLDGIEEAGSERVFLIAGSGVIAYLALALRTPGVDGETSQATRRFEQFVEQPPGTDATESKHITASELDEGIEAAIENGGEAVVVLRERLRTTAAAVYGEVTNTSPETARAAVNRGQWCRDPVAAAFLAGPDGPSHPLAGKIRLLIVPDRERRRRIERTMTAIERLEGT